MSQYPRTFVLGIDGVPYSFLQSQFSQEKMPHLASLCKKYGAHQMKSVYPTVSAVAWATYMTGTNPAEHNIFGFIDRIANPFEITINTGSNRRGKTIWDQLSHAGKKVIVINVPMTYPPEPVNGILASCFLCPDIDNLAYPPEMNTYFKEKGYCIDVDAEQARQSKREFLSQLNRVMDNRFSISFDLMKTHPWDFFQLHIMETDRLLHFFQDAIDTETEFSPDVQRFFDLLDRNIGDLTNRLAGRDRLLILSDHGFCGVKAEVQLNMWLEKEGLLKFDDTQKKTLMTFSNGSLCYSLLPGRIFINLEGREEHGSVKKSQYDEVRNEIKDRISAFRDPETGQPVIAGVFFREELYTGPYFEGAADIIVHPHRGYDLKSRVEDGIGVFNPSFITGMHTYSDAFICGVNLDITKVESIADVKQYLVP